MLNDGLIIKGVNADYLNFYLGLAIILAMAANTYVGRVAKGAGRWLSTTSLRVEHLTKSFGPVVALRDINLTCARARCSGCSATTAPASRR